MMNLRPFLLWLGLFSFHVTSLPILAAAPAEAPQNRPFRFESGDRVVLLGDGLIEQEQYFGWIELMLTASHPDANLTFRNLGWSADTPAGDSRFGLSLLQAGNEPADEGWKQLQKQIEQTKPTVLILGYGMSNALEAYDADTLLAQKERLEQFVSDYRRLLETAKKISPDVRFVFLSSIGLVPTTAASTNNQTAAIRDAIHETYLNATRQLASEYGAFVDLSTVAENAKARKDAIHLNALGYQQAAKAIETQLSLPQADWQNSPQAEKLRDLILRKNEWWFHRSRPANMAYVFGFRKREQGQNAVEIPQFDALIEKEEAIIAKLRSLKPTEVPVSKVTLKSKYAEFTAQPHPEFAIDDDWEITLWAENPLLNKPIHMNFDAQGRLWIASSEAYPMIEVGQAAPDRVLILEDTTGDGKADASTVFAEGLLIPTGIAPGDGGVYVAQSTDLLFLEDTDGDGKADEKTRVLSGFGTEDTHHNLHTLLWGPDGRLYMNQSVYTRTDAETPQGVVRLKAGGGFRFDTRDQRMEVFFRGLWNSWGHQFDAFGQSFLTDGAGFAGIAYSFPGATFNPTPKARHILDLISPGRWPKFASLVYIEGESYPPEWQGSLVTCDFRANRVTRFSVTEQGAGFVTQQEPDLVRTSAATFRPIDVKLGPDGALYVADWSNPIINHGEVDFRDPRRDRWHGRIWRLRWKGAKGSAPPKSLAAASTADLLDTLATGDRYERDVARRLLVEQEAELSADSLAKWTAKLDSGRSRLEALWLHDALNIPNLALLEELLGASDHRIRSGAVRVLQHWLDDLDGDTGLKLLTAATADDHPRVNLEAARALSSLGTAQAVDLAFQLVSKAEDRFIRHALQLAAVENSEVVLSALSEGLWNDSDASAKLEFFLTSIEPLQATEFISRRLAENPIEGQGSGPWIELIGKAGGPGELNHLLEQILADALSPQASQRALRALRDAQRLRRVRPQQPGRIAKLLQTNQSTEAETMVETLGLIGEWKLRHLTKTVAGFAQDDQPQITRAAIDALAAVGGRPAAEQIQAAIENALPKKHPHLVLHAIIALAKTDFELAGPWITNSLANTTDENEALAMWRGLLNIRGMGDKLADALNGQELSPSAVSSGIRATRDGGREEPKLASLLQSMGQFGPTELTPEFVAELVAAVTEADPAQGEMVYRRAELACSTCHAIGGIGGMVGPDMTSLGASAPVDYLVESLFDPNAKIKENYHSVSIITEDDQILTGIEVNRSADEVVLRDANNKLISISTNDIVAEKPAQSLMPAGVMERLTKKEQADLIAFLSRLGKPGDFDASQGGVARIFECFAGTHRVEQQGTKAIIEGAEIPGWTEVRTLVRGDLPASLIQEATRQPVNIALVNVYLRTHIEVAQAGEVRLDANTATAMWIDGKTVSESSAPGSFQADLSAGSHSVLVRLDARGLPQAFRLESDDVAFVGIHE